MPIEQNPDQKRKDQGTGQGAPNSNPGQQKQKQEPNRAPESEESEE